MTIKHLTETKGGKALLSLLVLTLLALTLRSVVFSDASLTASANVGHAFVAGSLSHINTKEGQVVLDASKLSPGQRKTGTLTITGGGDGIGMYTISKANLTDTPGAPGLSRTLRLTIQDTSTGTQLFAGTVWTFTSSSPTVSIPPGTTHTFQFDLEYPLASANTALQGASMELVVQVTGVSQ